MGCIIELSTSSSIGYITNGAIILEAANQSDARLQFISTALSSLAVIIAMLGLLYQARVYERDWRPYLGFQESHFNMDHDGMYYVMELTLINVGKSIINCSLDSFRFTINGIEEKKAVIDNSTGVIVPGQKYSLSVFYISNAISCDDDIAVQFKLTYLDLKHRRKHYSIEYLLEGNMILFPVEGQPQLGMDWKYSITNSSAT